jgi:hypothetical protein
MRGQPVVQGNKWSLEQPDDRMTGFIPD